MLINNEYGIEEIVYLKTDPEQKERIVYNIILFPNNSLMYSLTCGESTTSHYGFEISREKAYK